MKKIIFTGGTGRFGRVFKSYKTNFKIKFIHFQKFLKLDTLDLCFHQK